MRSTKKIGYFLLNTKGENITLVVATARFACAQHQQGMEEYAV
jgi:hypothetical protein